MFKTKTIIQNAPPCKAACLSSRILNLTNLTLHGSNFTPVVDITLYGPQMTYQIEE
jgi:hypothetical protein